MYDYLPWLACLMYYDYLPWLACLMYYDYLPWLACLMPPLAPERISRMSLPCIAESCGKSIVATG